MKGGGGEWEECQAMPAWYRGHDIWDGNRRLCVTVRPKRAFMASSIRLMFILLSCAAQGGRPTSHNF